ncbi:MAG: protein kinase [Acidobacteria bacterium]|nr:protein kinase [Acidobacteriota bacterium]NIM62362.1 protein kinase [Acidobacteriota bacterium]NIO60671.1 protein kinase [Acidobacteriota bacterium]NIQ31737.1 protein kinase [Acidobacteriota bacterium]NIQ87042.1 protein kinase [Acidobacteriota bacterium]
MTLEPGRVLGPYRLIEKIGEGGMGVVWKAEDTSLERKVALKVLPESFAGDAQRRERFEREAKAIAALNHPNIVTIFGVREEAGHYFFTMELISGAPLKTLIRPGGMSFEEFLRIAVPVADAVGRAHENGITHGDLKPGNVVVGEDRVKLLDFGLARKERPRVSAAAASGDTTVTLTDSGRISGTLHYLSPEVIQGRQADHLSDIFSLGVTLYEMVTGLRPFRGESTAEVSAAILKDTPRSVREMRPEIPRQLERVITACLQKDPEQRLQSALDMRNELRALERVAVAGTPDRAPSIAVLPFADMSPDKDQDYFCDGIAEEIINSISRIEHLRVASRTSSFQFKDAALDSREIGDRLGVGRLLEGSVRKAGERLRISVQLVNVVDGLQLWSQQYDRDLRDVFVIQDEISASIVDALELRLSPRERRAIKQVATADVRAYDYYLRGRRAYYYQYGWKGVELALHMFSKAIEIDPNYAIAYAGIADCRSFLYMNAERSDENLEGAMAASDKALELDPDLAEAHNARGQVMFMCERYDEAQQALERAIELNPRLFDAQLAYARTYFASGRPEKAAQSYERAMELQPDDYQTHLLLGFVYSKLGRTADAQAVRRRGVRLVEERLEFDPNDVRALYLGANALVSLGEFERGLEWTCRALTIEPREPMLLYNAACIYCIAGRFDEAIEFLERAVRHGFSNRDWMRNDVDLDPLHDSPRFSALVESIG